MRFIQAVIADEIKVRKVAKKQIMLQCKSFGLKTMSELNQIISKFVRKSASVIDHSSDSDNPNENEEEKEDEESAGDLAAEEYNYLLTMPIWSLTLERVNALQSDMD